MSMSKSDIMMNHLIFILTLFMNEGVSDSLALKTSCGIWMDTETEIE